MEVHLSPALPELRLHDGNEIHINGRAYRINLVPGPEIAFNCPPHLPDGTALHAADVERFRRVLEVMERLAQEVTLLNERLLDPLDGATGRAIHELMSAPQVSHDFRRALRPYALALFKHGSNVHTERGSVMAPALPRAAFHAELAKLPAQKRGSLPWRDVLDHLFDAVPRVTQGFYLFERPADFRRFELSLGHEYASTCKQLRRVFDEAVLDGPRLPARRWQNLDQLSQRVLLFQKERLELALQEDEPIVRAVASRVWIRCYDGGELRFLVRPYGYAFDRELTRCAALLDEARDIAPPVASELRDVLADLAEWCRERTHDEAWAESRPSWVGASDPNSLLDVSLTAEEKVSRLGTKGCFQLLVCAHDHVPEPARPVFEALGRVAHDGYTLNMLWLRQLIVGGGASNATIHGEKLPDREGHSLYKIMTFTNIVRASFVRANADRIRLATGCSSGAIERLGDAASLLVLLHEYGHTRGDLAAFLGDIGSSAEETNAEASVLPLAKRLAPGFLDDLLLLLVCWTPVLRAMQGPSEAHSHADLVLFDELENAGAVEVVREGDRTVIRPRSIERAVETAFALAMRMRLWEYGVPQSQHEALVEPFDASDAGQDARLQRAARAWTDALTPAEFDGARARVVAECRSYFSPERIQKICNRLDTVLAQLPQHQPLTVVPTDARLASILSS
jgi:hypothetical protein